MKQCLLAGLFFFLLVPVALGAPAKEGNGGKKTVPTSITADNMEYNADKQTVVFNGNVHVVRPDFEIWSLKLTVFLHKNDKTAPEKNKESSSSISGMRGGDIDRIVAQGKVRLKSEDRYGTSDTATYFAKTDKFVMEGNPVLRDKDSTIKGTRIVHFIEANKSEVQGNVDATFMAPDKASPIKSPKMQQQQ